MGVKISQGKPPKEIPEEVRASIHRRLDALMNAYEWGDPLPLSQTFGWYLGGHAGEVRLTVGEPFA